MTTKVCPNAQSPDPLQLAGLLAELGMAAPGPINATPVSLWSSQHVHRVDCQGRAWAFLRCLPGPALRYPGPWLKLRAVSLLAAAGIGPQLYGITPGSAALGGRAAVLEAALTPLERPCLQARASQAVALLARLHGSSELAGLLAGQWGSPEPTANPFDEMVADVRRALTCEIPALWCHAGMAGASDLAAIAKGLLDSVCGRAYSGPLATVRVPAHGDPNYSNFATDEEGRLRMIDFGDLSLTSPVADLGPFLTWYVPHANRRQMLAENYPHAPAADVLDLAHSWTPVRYLAIAMHWARRLAETGMSPSSRRTATASLGEWLVDAAGLVPDRAAGEWASHQARELIARLGSSQVSQ